MSKLCQISQSPFNVGKSSQATMLFYTTYLPLSEFCDPCDCGQISENIFFFLNFLMQKIFLDRNHWFQLLSTKNDCWQRKQPLTYDENFIATPHQVI